MTCPFCNEELEKGYIKSSHAIQWGPVRELGLVNGDIVLAKPSFLKDFLWSHTVVKSAEKSLFRLTEPFRNAG